MARVLTPAMTTEIGLTVTKPGMLVEILFDGYTVRYSSFGDVNWDSKVWINQIVAVDGLAWDDNGMVSGGRLSIGNHDNAFGALALLYDVADKPIRIWHAYREALDAGSPVLVFDGVGDQTEIGHRVVEISLAIAGSDALYSPREFYSPATGFNHLPPIGEEISFNGEIFRLDRAEF